MLFAWAVERLVKSALSDGTGCGSKVTLVGTVSMILLMLLMYYGAAAKSCFPASNGSGAGGGSAYVEGDPERQGRVRNP